MPDPNGSEGLTQARRTELVGTAETATALPPTMKPTGGVGGQRTDAAETDRGQAESELWRLLWSPENLNAAWHRVRANGGAKDSGLQAIGKPPPNILTTVRVFGSERTNLLFINF